MAGKTQTFAMRRQLSLSHRLKLDGLPARVHAQGLGGSIAFTAAFGFVFLLYKDVAVWDGWVEAQEFSLRDYRQRVYADSVFRTRMNTWSNLPFIFVGCYVLALAWFDQARSLQLQRGYLAHTPPQSAIFGIAMIYTGLGSALFHGALTRFGHRCDVGAMYAAVFVLGGFCIGSWAPRVPRTRFKSWPIILAIVIAASIYFFVYKFDYSFGNVTRPVTWTLLAFVAVSLLQPGKSLQLRWFVAAVVMIGGGAYIRQLDIDRKFTGPDSIWQGHAIWHVMAALYYACLYAYFRSEERAAD